MAGLSKSIVCCLDHFPFLPTSTIQFIQVTLLYCVIFVDLITLAVPFRGCWNCLCDVPPFSASVLEHGAFTKVVPELKLDLHPRAYTSRIRTYLAAAQRPYFDLSMSCKLPELIYLIPFCQPSYILRSLLRF